MRSKVVAREKLISELYLQEVCCSSLVGHTGHGSAKRNSPDLELEQRRGCLAIAEDPDSDLQEGISIHSFPLR